MSAQRATEAAVRAWMDEMRDECYSSWIVRQKTVLGKYWLAKETL